MASNLPNYVATATPVPQANRIPWYKSTAQTYAGIMLWFVFWDSVPFGGGMAGGTLAHGLAYAFGGLVAAALICHFLYYLVPGMLGLKTGLPLYIVGTSTYGVRGGFIMPGFLMGLLQFGWLAVNACMAAKLLCAPFYEGNAEATLRTPPHMIVAAVWAIAAAFMGLMGIRYVAKWATYLPIIPFVILLVLFVMTAGGITSFKPADAISAVGTKATALSEWGVVAMVMTTIIGFFATAGAAGTDFGMNNRNGKDVQLGGLVGIAGSTIFAGGLALLIVAGAYGHMPGPLAGQMKPTGLLKFIVGDKAGAVFMYLLAIASFPPACFSAFIAANSFKTTLPKIKPFVSVGLGTLVSIILAVTGWADQVVEVFVLIGASFGPICGAMMADYLLSGRKWSGPRAGFNPAGWISWAVGFVIGAADLLAKYGPMVAERLDKSAPQLAHYAGQLEALKGIIPVPPLSALVVGFVLYFILALLGIQTRKLEMPQTTEEPAATT